MEACEFVGFGGVRIAADAFGSADAPPVLLIPSGGQTKEFWHGSAQALAQAGRYAICVDLRGHGDSGHAADGRYDLDAYAQDLRAILAALPSRAQIVAAGLGAIASLAAVGESDPHAVSGLTLIDFNIWFEEAELETAARSAVGTHDGRRRPATTRGGDRGRAPQRTCAQRTWARFRPSPPVTTVAWNGAVIRARSLTAAL